MKLKIFKKLFLTTACLLFVTLTLVFVLMSVFVNDELAKSKYDVLNKCCAVITDSLINNFGDVTNVTYNQIATLSDVNSIDIYVADTNGRIQLCSCDVFASNTNCLHSNTILSQKFLNGISTEGNLELSSIDGMYDKMCYTSSKRISISDNNSFYVIAVSHALTSTDLIKRILGMYAISAIIPIAFMFIAEYSFMYRIIRPLKYMSISAKAIAKGDFSKRVPVMSNDEMGELSILFNKMSDSLSRTETTSKSFVANISHELKTPMTTISGFIDGIIDGTITEDKRNYYLNIVSDEIKRMSRLVQSMLSLAKLESGDAPINKTELRLSDSIVNIVVSMEQKINAKNIDIVGLDELTKTEIFGDADLIYQVIYNLVDNAVKFTHENGSIIFSLLRIDNTLEFRIRNNGNSIPIEDLPHIFEKFYKTDKSRSNQKDSLGLGLYISKTIVELHGGTITVNNLEGGFTEFVVHFPINYN